MAKMFKTEAADWVKAEAEAKVKAEQDATFNHILDELNQADRADYEEWLRSGESDPDDFYEGWMTADQAIRRKAAGSTDLRPAETEWDRGWNARQDAEVRKSN